MFARDTGATVVVPIYPLAPQGTAGAVVPVMADLISAQIDQHGAANVGVTGDSSGGGIALTAVQELVRRGDPVPAHMVLISPALDLTFSNPAIQFVDSPILTATTLRRAQQWAGDLPLDDPRVSGLFGSLAGLPPTAVYSGNLDLLSPDVLVLQDKALATPGADFTFILRNEELHVWAATFWLPEAQAVLPDIYQQLGLTSEPSPTVNPLAVHIENGLVTETPTLDGPSMDPGITGNIGAPIPGVSDLASTVQLNATAPEDPWTGEPSIVSQVFTGVFRVLGVVGKLFGAQSALTFGFSPSFLGPLLTSDGPPWFTTLGLNVRSSEFEGMPVWTLQSPGSTSGKTVVAIHGGGYVYWPNIFHWLDYAAMARDTGATVVVPIYPLAPTETAATVVPQTADFLFALVEQHRAENVSGYGDSAGGGLALLAVQELVRRGDPVPARMVLISPWLDASMSDPASQTIDDPMFGRFRVDPVTGVQTGHQIRVVQSRAGQRVLVDRPLRRT
jgi:acetyl esterase/lipase